MSQIKKRGIEDNAVDGAKLRLLNEQTLRGRNAAGTSDVDILKVDSSDNVTLLKVPSMDAALPIPNAPKQLATIEYVQEYVLGKTDAKDAVHCASAVHVALTGAGQLVVDDFELGVATSSPVKRVLLFGQLDRKDNGIYDYTYAAGNYTLTRSTDFDENAEVTSGAYTRVINGTVYSMWDATLNTADPIVVGVDPLDWTLMPTVARLVPGDMLKNTDLVIAVDLATVSGLESTNPGDNAGQLRARVDQAALEKDKSTKLDTATNAIVGKRSRREQFTLGAGDITNGYVDLANVATQGSVRLGVKGFGEQFEGDDFTVNYTGGTGSNTRVTLAGGLAVGGTSALIAGDKVQVDYESF